MNCGEAVRDTSTVLGRQAAEAKEQRETIIGQWMGLGYSREEAYKAALFGFRKPDPAVVRDPAAWRRVAIQGRRSA